MKWIHVTILVATTILSPILVGVARADATDDVSLREGAACNLNLYGNRTLYSGTEISVINTNDGSAVLVLIKIVSRNNRGETYTSFKRMRVEAGSDAYVGCTGEGSEYGSAGLTFTITGAHYVD